MTPGKGTGPLRIVDRLGFRFLEYGEDHDFQLGPGANRFANLIFAASAGIVLAAVLFGFVTPVTVKAPISGQIEPEHTHKIYPKITGPIADLEIKRGDIVAVGDTIALLRAEDYEETLAELEFKRSQAQKRLEQLRESYASRLEQLDSKIRQQGLALEEIDTSSDEVRTQRERAVLVAEQELTKARLLLADAQRKVEANEKLAERGVIARNQLEESRTQLELAQSEVAIKEKDLEAAEQTLATTRRQDTLGSAKGEEEFERLQSERRALAGEQELEIAAAEHEVRNLERQIERGETEVGRRAVLATAAGAVLDVPVTPGETVSPSVLVALVADLDELVLVAFVPEVHRKRLEVGQEAVLKFPTYRDYEFRGRLSRISPSAKLIENRAMYEVRLEVEPPERLPALRASEDVRLLPGMTASGDVLVDKMRALKYVVVVKMLRRG